MTMSFEHRAIQVGNDDASIMYVGNWTTVQASALNSGGNYGPLFSSTSRSTTSISSFIFPFQGSSVSVFGTVNVANSSTGPNPTWHCFVDGSSLGAPDVFYAFENNWPLCGQGNIPDGPHKLVVNVTSQGMPFYLDYIQYQPSPSVSLENSLIVIQNNDPAIDYISGWRALGGTANQTTDPEGLVNVTFVGTQLSWYGFIPTEEPHTQSSGEYSVDDQPFSSFELLGLPGSSVTIYNQLFFITTVFEMGTHTLSARYTGSPGQTPFTLDYLIIANGSFTSTNSTSVNSSRGPSEIPTSSPTSSTSDTIHSSPQVKRIVAGVVGTIGGILVSSFVVFLWLKSRKRRNIDNNNKIFQSNRTERGSPQPQFIFQITPRLISSLTDERHEPVYKYQSPQIESNRTSSSFSTSLHSTHATDEVSRYEYKGPHPSPL